MKLTPILVSLSALLAAPGLSMAQSMPMPPTTSAAAGDVGQVDDIEVVGRLSPRQRAESFVAEVGAAPGEARLARWDRSLCVGAGAMERDQAQRLIDRVSIVAASLGLQLGAPGCKANVMIMATTTADALAQDMVRSDPNGFQPAFGNSDAGNAALERFQRSDTAVRWWQVSLPVSADTGQVAIRMKGDDEPPSISSPSMSRLRGGVRDDLARIYIIVDTTKLGDVSFDALCDYIAMIALAQINDRADTTRYDTILNLFKNSSVNSRLSQWDFAYLKYLYEADRSLAHRDAQMLEIASRLGRSTATP